MRKIKKLLYGICKAERQWAETIESLLTQDENIERITGVRQIYISEDRQGNIKFFFAKLTDDLLVA